MFASMEKLIPSGSQRPWHSLPEPGNTLLQMSLWARQNMANQQLVILDSGFKIFSKTQLI